MKWLEAKVIFDGDDNEFAVDLIAGIFYANGLKGVVIETPDDGSIDNWAEGSKPDITYYAVAGYFSKDNALDEHCQLLEDELLRLKQIHNISSTISYREIDEEDWAESWKEFFWPEKISENIVVKPTWREYTSQKDEIVIEIDPGMAFGTGTHPTTSLCINMIEKHLNPGDSVLDVGTGSGILMVAAAKLGVGVIHGIDNDPMAVEIAERNLILNNINPSKYNVTKGDLVSDVHQKYNLVVSNILAHVIIDLLENIKEILVKDVIFICSCFTIESKDTVEKKMIAQSFKIVEYEVKEDWVVVVGQLVTT
jgi:ribosomal protein L11 methyltransferase